VKTNTLANGFYLLVVAMVSALAGRSQTSLEFASGAGPSGTGISIANQVVTFKDNTNNPVGNTFIAYSTPTITTTFSFTNQQYSLPTAQMTTQTPMVFGAAINSGGGQNALKSSLYVQMSAISSPANSDFTSEETVAAGTGISVNNNYATEMMISAMPLYNAGVSTTGRYYMGDFNITFSSPLTDPVIHFVGIGANYSSLGYTSEFDLQTAGVSLAELSGSTELSVVANNIINTAAHPGPTTGSGAASGSIVAMGINITSLSFKVYLQGDGGMPTWSNNTTHAGDQILVAVSTNVPLIVLPVNLKDFTATALDAKSQLQWTTATENNSSFFDVQYSTDQVNWQSIGSVKAAGNSIAERKYSFVHTDPTPGDNYYRLRIVDLDNQSSWSSVRVVTFADNVQLSCYPNPTKGTCTITTNGAPITSVTLISVDGRQLLVQNNFISGNTIDLAPYPTGLYFLSVKDNAGKTQLLKVLKE